MPCGFHSQALRSLLTLTTSQLVGDNFYNYFNSRLTKVKNEEQARSAIKNEKRLTEVKNEE